ncbi:Cyclic nucleotide-gated potassium channel [Allorhodopirellula heiligendammensis]|uniref:Cyclic nucleotide-gated potassium channel n=2 Tax=Allorhodopirellula heiligendammensis TaxID=2714739 RepID=A0A5C6C5N5_9BACT|nr:ion transporter [Allorhodopirellula heiligendammensis]TWU19903.1 Cyclic nucleotide-gated potassium channel [Allorhodopirellula heiligendammensis]
MIDARPTKSFNMTAATLRRRVVQRPEVAGVRQQMYDIIFEADTPAGRAFDIGLLIAIIASVVLVSIETLPQYSGIQTAVSHGELINTGEAAPEAMPLWLPVGEWLLTILFTVEYAARLSCVRHPMRYAKSFWGIVDLLSILPSYMVFFVGNSAKSFAILRSIRLLRVFRVLKLWRMMSQADELADAVWRSRDKIIVFLSVVLVAVTISGALMYHIETVMVDDPQDSDFTSIPQSMYWAIVTMTTVGYGDVVAHTTIGKIISAALILLGYSLIIVPTGFVSAELSQQMSGNKIVLLPCPQCGGLRHRSDADYCYRCGAHLEHPPDPVQD